MKKLFFVLTIFLTVSAEADFQLRIFSNQLLGGDVDGFNRALETTVTGTPDLEKKLSALGGDIRYSPPLAPFSFGVRYEQWNGSKSGSGTLTGSANAVEIKTEFSGSRTSLLLGYNLISLPIFSFGILGQYALASDFKFKRETSYGPTTRINNYGSEMAPGYGLAVEGSLRIAIIVLSAEVGYTVLKTSSMKDDGEFLTTNMSGVNVDFSGTYGLFTAGIAF